MLHAGACGDAQRSAYSSHRLAATYMLDAIRNALLGLVPPPAISVPQPAPRLIPLLHVPQLLTPRGQVVSDAELQQFLIASF